MEESKWMNTLFYTLSYCLVYTFSFKLNLTIESGSCIMDQGNHMHACMHVQVSWYTYLTAVIGLGMCTDLGG